VPVLQGELLWQPDPPRKQASRLQAFIDWLAARRGLAFKDYGTLWQWSVDDIDDFWSAIWEFFDVQADGDASTVLGTRDMPGAHWFPNTQLNYAEHAFRNASEVSPAIISRREGAEPIEMSWSELRAKVGALAAYLKSIDVNQGDRVVSYMPNIPETVIAFLASASIGAVWSSCSSEMGTSVVLDRFRQIEPKVLFAVDGYSYNGRMFDRSEAVQELIRELPSIQHVVHCSIGGIPERRVTWPRTRPFEEVVARPAPLEFVRLPFGHPLWIVYSSGTTGLPKAMVHSHGGIVLTHLKTHQLQHDLRTGDRLLFLGGTGWIVWNLLVGGLLCGATITLYDGNPSWPKPETLWKFIDVFHVTHLGCGAAYLMACKKSQIRPRDFVDLNSLRAITSTGSPLALDTYEWVYRNVKPDVWLASISGGTDVASGFVASAPVLPVYAGEIQCRELGVAAYAFNEAGQPVVEEVGELVITQPMPSMPLCFWGDTQGKRYLESYFEMFPGVWRQGDWIRFTERGTSVIYGRSDTTINRHGIRMGTAEIYRVVEELDAIKDSLVVDLEYLGRDSYMPLFVVLQPGYVLDLILIDTIKTQIRKKASARHVPDEVFAIEAVPRTLTGKKMELPVRKVLLGMDPASVVNPESMANPESFQYFVALALHRRGLGQPG
jgi:acetoacetyl-CoA synthetase